MLTAAEVDRLGSDWLRSDPVSTNVIGTQLAGLLAGRIPAGVDDLWALVVEAGRTVGVVMQTPPQPIFLPRLAPGAPSAVATAVAQTGRFLPGANGEIAAVGEFCRYWSAATGCRSERRRAMRMYRLGRLAAPNRVQGHCRQAGPADVELVAGWLAEFHHETRGGTTIDARGLASRRCAAGEIWLWTDAQRPVSLAARSAVVAGVARIGPVYTPRPSRGRGFGSAVTASATRAALEDGAAEVVLYTDLANPTSNTIYQAIGYVPDHDAEERVFS